MPAQASTPIRRSSRAKRPLRRRVAARPLGDGTSEVVRVIEFVWPVGESIQPVLMIERELLN